MTDKFPQQDQFLISSSDNSSSAVSFASAWEVLDEYAQAIESESETVGQVRLTLAAIRQSLGVEAVFWFPGKLEGDILTEGSINLNPEWCCAFVQTMLDETPGVESQLLRTAIRTGESRLPFCPQSAAMVRVSKSKGAWLVAVNFRTGRQLCPDDMRIMRLARRLMLTHRQHMIRHSRIREVLLGVVRCLSSAIDAFVPGNHGHSERVALMAVRLGREMGLDESQLADVYLGGLLHDIGNIALPHEVFLKPASLTDAERRKIEEHPSRGDKMLASVGPLAHIRPAIRYHHERWDGTGYPDRLKGEQIPFIGRLMAVAEAFDAMMSPRPYRDPLSGKKIAATIRVGAGQEWDPEMARCVLACQSDLERIYESVVTESIPELGVEGSDSLFGEIPGDLPRDSEVED